MAYMKIQNLYKDQDILLFKEAYAMEKIHGTSAHIAWNGSDIRFFSGGEPHDRFVSIFDQESLLSGFKELGHEKIIVYGEAYGGKQQGMSAIYGKELKFIVFDIKIDTSWLSVSDMHQIASDNLKLEVVDYVKITTDLDKIDYERDRPSVQAMRNGCGDDKPREGIILRPLIEVTKNSGNRIIAKHKQDKFSERATPQKIVNPDKLEVLSLANDIANEWVTEMRLSHVLDKLGNLGIEDTPTVIKAMIEDVLIEAEGEIEDSKEARRAIGSRAAKLFKQRLVDKLKKGTLND